MSTVALREPALSRFAAATAVYGGGFVIGATLVSFPASSAFLRATHGFTDAQYGAIYLPQLLAATAGALLGGLASKSWSLGRMYVSALVLFGAAHALLAVSAGIPSGAALWTIMAATACFGFGFGFGGGPLNGLVALLYPRTSNTAITALHMTAGAGLTVAPFFFASLATQGRWIVAPLSLLLITIALLALTLRTELSEPGPVPATAVGAATAVNSGPRLRSDSRFVLALVAAVAYALAEGTFSNWAVLYVQDDLVLSVRTAAAALTAFWAMVTLGRLAAAVLALRIRPVAFLITLPLLMAGALLVLRSVHSPGSVVLAFGFAGVACSAFIPMLVGFSAEYRPRDVSTIAAMLTAALMVGVGIGSYAVGAMRGSTPIREMYLYSLVYPLVALAAIAVASGRGRAQRT